MSEKTEKPTTQSSPYLVPIAIITAGGLVGAGIYFGSKHPPEADLGQQAVVQVQEGEVAGEEVPQYETTVGDFLVLDGEICREEGKPIVYYFGSTGCSHCSWEHPVLEEVVGRFGDYVSFHNNMDDQEGTDMDVMEKYREVNPGYIPFTILGCRYAKVGSGEQAGEEAEKAALTELICELTNNQPSQVCQ